MTVVERAIALWLNPRAELLLGAWSLRFVLPEPQHEKEDHGAARDAKDEC
jgi:hypothetical protein